MSTRAWINAVRAVLRRQLLTLVRHPADLWTSMAVPLLSLTGALLLAGTFVGQTLSSAGGSDSGTIDLRGYLLVSAVFWAFVEGQLTLGFGLLTEMRRGTMEGLFLSAMPRSAYLTGVALYNLLRTLLNVAVVVVTALVMLGPLTIAHPAHSVLLSLLNLAVVYGYGLIIAGAMLLLRTSAFTYALSSTLPLLVGSWFSVTVLPEPLRRLALTVPLTHGLDALRWAVAGSPTAIPLHGEYAYIACSAVVMPVAGAMLFNLVERMARQRGTLGQF